VVQQMLQQLEQDLIGRSTATNRVTEFSAPGQVSNAVAMYCVCVCVCVHHLCDDARHLACMSRCMYSRMYAYLRIYFLFVMAMFFISYWT
jgi:hypothetical protein